MNDQNFDIDLIYTWVNGEDPQWISKKKAITGDLYNHSETDCKGRYIDNDELKYSLRSVEKYLPWVRKIFIVTDEQVPTWLNLRHPKIQIIDHKDILPPEALPCFNALVIEYYIYKIPDLSEHFLLANDDMFINAKISPDFFFTKDAYPIIRLKKKPFGKWHYRLKILTGRKLGQYRKSIIAASLFVEQKYGKYYSGIPHHNIDAYNKSDYKIAVEKIFKNQVESSMPHHIRTYGDLQRSAFSYYALAIEHGHLKNVGRTESSRMLPYRHNLKKYEQHYHPKLFCINDNQHVTDKNRSRIKPFLEELFSGKSSFEK